MTFLFLQYLTMPISAFQEIGPGGVPRAGKLPEILQDKFHDLGKRGRADLRVKDLYPYGISARDLCRVLSSTKGPGFCFKTFRNQVSDSDFSFRSI